MNIVEAELRYAGGGIVYGCMTNYKEPRVEFNVKDMSKESLEKAREQREEELKEINKAIEEKEVNKLYLEVGSDGSLCVCFNDVVMGYIEVDGECSILSTTPMVNVYEEWRESGMHIDDSVVAWEGGVYRLSYRTFGFGSIVLCREDIVCGYIYDFNSCNTCDGCKDDNIKRFKHNNRPIIF
jgi:hypothetical protein